MKIGDSCGKKVLSWSVLTCLLVGRHHNCPSMTMELARRSFLMNRQSYVFACTGFCVHFEAFPKKKAMLLICYVKSMCLLPSFALAICYSCIAHYFAMEWPYTCTAAFAEALSEFECVEVCTILWREAIHLKIVEDCVHVCVLPCLRSNTVIKFSDCGRSIVDCLSWLYLSWSSCFETWLA